MGVEAPQAWQVEPRQVDGIVAVRLVERGAERVGGAEDGRVAGLPHDLVQGGVGGAQAKALGERVGVEGDRRALADGRQLARIADEEHLAAAWPRAHVRDEVVEHRGAAVEEVAVGGGPRGHHRGLVDDEERGRGVGVGLAVEAEAGAALERLDGVEVAVDGRGRVPAPVAQHAGGAGGRRDEVHGASGVAGDADDRLDERRLAGARRPGEREGAAAAGEERAGGLERRRLGRREGERRRRPGRPAGGGRPGGGACDGRRRDRAQRRHRTAGRQAGGGACGTPEGPTAVPTPCRPLARDIHAAGSPTRPTESLVLLCIRRGRACTSRPSHRRSPATAFPPQPSPLARDIHPARSPTRHDASWAGEGRRPARSQRSLHALASPTPADTSDVPVPDSPTDAAAFIAKWAASQAAERGNYQTFLYELAGLLGVPRPDATQGTAESDGYVFDRAISVRDTARSTTGYLDLYKRGCFVLETKQGADRRSAAAADANGKAPRKTGHGVRGTALWERALVAAKAQAQRYAQNLGPTEPVPPFLVVADVGYCIDLYADFSGSGRSYTPFPDARSFRIPLADLAREDVRETLRLVWTDPAALDPTRRQARVTRDFARQLARFSALLETSVPAERRGEIPRFVTRCLFCLFAEDTGLIPERGFSTLLAAYRDRLDVVEDGLAGFFQTLDRGGFSPELKTKLRRFNGDLFTDAAALPLTRDALDLLVEAGRADWRLVEPAIFGTLLERALDPAERHQLGAHFTPRAYVERLVLPAVIEPLRREWEATQAAVAKIETDAEDRASGAATGTGDDRAARTARAAALAELAAFQSRLATLRILDPACGSGNFLYVTLDHLKRVSRVLNHSSIQVTQRYAHAADGDVRAYGLAAFGKTSASAPR